jgi:hypothetical protein
MGWTKWQRYWAIEGTLDGKTWVRLERYPRSIHPTTVFIAMPAWADVRCRKVRVRTRPKRTTR